ncbi:unnamed protein product [Symbiodinium microadriaticum]|nr:unnamed protein product [Symbiodinium microadriaticum]
MDLFSKGYKFLSELDDPKAEGPALDLESSLDGVAEKWLGWARGAEPTTQGSSNAEGQRRRLFSEDSVDGEGGQAPRELQTVHALEQGAGGATEASADRVVQEEPADHAVIPALPTSELAAPAGVSEETFQGNPFDGNPFAEPGEVQQSVEPAEPAEPAKEPEEAATSAQEPAWSADPTPDLSRESREFEESSQAEPAEPSASPYVEAAQAEAAAAEPQPSGAESANVPEASEVPVEAGGQEQLGEEGIGADSSPEAVTEGDGLAQHPGPQCEHDTATSTASREGAPTEQAEAVVAGEGVLLQNSPLAVESQPMASPKDGDIQREATELRAQLEDAHGQLRQRERQLADLSNVLADMEAREVARRDQTQTVRTKATEAVRAAEREMQSARKRAEQAEVNERRLKQEARDMEQELHKAQEAWKDRIRKAESKAQEAEKDAKDAAAASSAELAKLKARMRVQAAGSEETRGELEAYKARTEEEMSRLGERLRAAADSELQLRQELQQSEQSRQELQERVVELSGQLEHAQQAYSEAAREVGAMSLRLNELEFTQRDDSHSEDVLRHELSSAKERLSEMDDRLKECTWMRDHALKQAEEARAKLQSMEEAQAQAQQSQKEAGSGQAIDGGCWQIMEDPFAPITAIVCRQEAWAALQTAQGEVEALQQQLQKFVEQHKTELQEQAEISREEIEYLKRKNDEKDKRLEILTCERNALRYAEGTEASSRPGRVAPKTEASEKPLVDLEDGLSLKEVLSKEPGAGGAVKAFFADGDLVLKRFSKLLFASPTTRRIFYGYVLLLHIWIWVVLHRAAAVHSAHTISKPIVPNPS